MKDMTPAVLGIDQFEQACERVGFKGREWSEMHQTSKYVPVLEMQQTSRFVAIPVEDPWPKRIDQVRVGFIFEPGTERTKFINKANVLSRIDVAGRMCKLHSLVFDGLAGKV